MQFLWNLRFYVNRSIIVILSSASELYWVQPQYFFGNLIEKLFNIVFSMVFNINHSLLSLACHMQNIIIFTFSYVFTFVSWFTNASVFNIWYMHEMKITKISEGMAR